MHFGLLSTAITVAFQEHLAPASHLDNPVSASPTLRGCG
jgi:hypothetical protein